jgi:putative acetyltransferase
MATPTAIADNAIRYAGAEDLKDVREIFLEYAAWVSDDICFRSFERELAALPGEYAPPSGGLLIAAPQGGNAGSRLAGCAAFRKLAATTAEMKRLYVRPAYRGSGLGRRLAVRIIEEARGAGYRTLRLDSLPRMEQALRMYRALGFQEIPPYGGNPPGAVCFELQL